MTDFLTRLAERTLGLTPCVEPVLAPRYAPGPATAEFPDTFDEAHDSLREPSDSPAPATMSIPGESSVSAPNQPQPDVASETPATSPMPRAVVEESAAADDRIEPAATRPVAIPETNAGSVMKTTVVRTSFPAEETPELAPPSAAQRSSKERGIGFQPVTSGWKPNPRRNLPPKPAATPVRQEEPTTANLPPASAVPIEMEVADQSVPHPEEPQAAPLRLSSAPQTPMETRTGGTGLLVRPAVERASAETVRPQPAATPGLGEPCPPANESTPSVIRVTIGRIDVRAVPPTPAAERSAPVPPPPVLSLDEYLKQHGGRER